MLTKDLLTKIEGLKEVDSAVIDQIVELSKNDENDVIAKKVREIHDSYDKDIADVTGLNKEYSEKSYDFLKRVLNGYKTEISTIEDINKELQQVKEKKAALEAQVKDGKVDEAIRQQLADANKTIKDLRADIETKKTEFDTKLSEREAEFNSYKLSSIQSLADVGLKFKKEYADDERALKYFKDGARDDAMKMGKPEIKEIDGKAEIIFRDEEGNVVTDSDNLMKPLTYSSVYRRNLSNVLAESKPQGGTGGKGGTNDNIVFGGYKSKKELSEHIRTYLASKNLHSTDITGKYQQEFDKLYAEHNTADLPMG